MLNLRQIGIWALGSLAVVLILAVLQSSFEEGAIQWWEWGVFSQACLINGETMLAAWFLGTAVRKQKNMPVGLGQAGIGLILAGLLLGAFLLIGDLSMRY